MRKTVATGFNFICGPQHEGDHPPAKSVPDAIKVLKDLLNIQSSDGNWNYDPYMHGMANGLICALSCIDGKPPKYLTAPKKWLADKPMPKGKDGDAIPTTASTDLRLTVQTLLKQLAIATENIDPDTMGKVYAVFRRFDIQGFKTPKLGGGKGGQTVKICTVSTKDHKVLAILRIASKGKGFEFQAFKHGNDNYKYDKITRKTGDLNNFLTQLLKVRSLKAHHDKIREYLGNKDTAAHKLHPSNKIKVSPKEVQAIIAWVQGRGQRKDTVKTLMSIKQSNRTSDLYRAIALEEEDYDTLQETGSVTLSQRTMGLVSWSYDEEGAQRFIRDHLRESNQSKFCIIYAKEIQGSDILLDVQEFTGLCKAQIDDEIGEEHNHEATEFWELVEREQEVLVKGKPYMYEINSDDLIRVRR